VEHFFRHEFGRLGNAEIRVALAGQVALTDGWRG
jgi:hypothetical protein